MGLRAAPGIEGVLHARAPAERPTSRRSRDRDPRRARRLGPRRPRAATGARPTRERGHASARARRRHQPRPRLPRRPGPAHVLGPHHLEPDRHVARRSPRLGRQPRRRHRDGHPDVVEQPAARRSASATSRRASRSTRPTASPSSPTPRAARSRVIRITNADPAGAFQRRRRHDASRPAPSRGTSSCSPDGRRVFVANSGQDTITVINALTPADHRPRRPAQQPSATTPTATATSSRAASPSTANNKRLYVTRFLVVHQARRQAGRRRRQGGRWSAVLEHQHRRPRTSPTTGWRERITLAPQVTGFTVDSQPATARPTRPRRSRTSSRASCIRGDQAYLPNIAASPERAAALQPRHAGVRQLDRRRRTARADATPARFLNLHLGAREPGARQEEAVLRQPVGDRLHDAERRRHGLRRLRRQRSAGQDQRGRRRAS